MTCILDQAHFSSTQFRHIADTAGLDALASELQNFTQELEKKTVLPVSSAAQLAVDHASVISSDFFDHSETLTETPHDWLKACFFIVWMRPI